MELRKVYEPVTIILVTSDLSPDIQKAADYAAIKNRKLMVFVVKEKAENSQISESYHMHPSLTHARKKKPWYSTERGLSLCTYHHLPACCTTYHPKAAENVVMWFVDRVSWKRVFEVSQVIEHYRPKQ